MSSETAETPPEPVDPPGSPDAANEDRPARKSFSPFVLAPLVLLLVVMLVYSPLLLAMVEQKLFGTMHVENACEAMGIHGALDALYDFTFAWLFD